MGQFFCSLYTWARCASHIPAAVLRDAKLIPGPSHIPSGSLTSYEAPTRLNLGSSLLSCSAQGQVPLTLPEVLYPGSSFTNLLSSKPGFYSQPSGSLMSCQALAGCLASQQQSQVPLTLQQMLPTAVYQDTKLCRLAVTPVAFYHEVLSSESQVLPQ